ncbi:MAG TPA: SOS response-associated peptidase family protein [Bacteroidia bacterium]|nr:SOS response-associated peptidase family protein [Bacteroidia bacterium]
MCYNVAYLEKRGERVAKHYGADFKPRSPELELFHVSGFVHPQLFVITSEEPQWGQTYQWGLIPKWRRDEEQVKQISAQTLNAKAETVFEKNSFHNIAKKRCIVIASGFLRVAYHRQKKISLLYLTERAAILFYGLPV